ncbi:MAG: citrate/2-methylcitrate synthase [Promethearchaeota archaeon]
MGKVQKGLENVNALETKISFIDGREGILEYRGYNINQLANLSYAAVSYLLIYGELPNESELTAFTKELRENREIDKEIIEVVHACNFNVEAMDVLRTAVSYLSHCDPDLSENTLEANLRKAMRIIAKVPTIIATFYRIRNGLERILPDSSLSHGANFLYMLRGSKPTETEAKIMEADFVISAEHELNASTFSARVSISTLSDLHSGISAGMGTLKGPLHGGARFEVMKMLDEIKTPEKAEEYVLNLITNKKRVMGFGHRVYKTYDPRGVIFKKLAREIAEEKGDLCWYEIAENIERTVIRELVEKRGKPIYPNVDFYIGVIYNYLGIPPKLATSVFSIGRVVGWIAHCIEQYADNRLIRPRAQYTGDRGAKIIPSIVPMTPDT